MNNTPDNLKREKVLLGPSSFASMDAAPMEYLQKTGCEIVDNPFKRKLTKEELLDLLGNGITGIIAGLEPLDREVMKESGLKVISRCGSGMSNIDISAAEELGIKVFSTPDGPTSAVAELTLGAMLSMLRLIPEMNTHLHDGKWEKRIGFQLEGKTVAIIGFGKIGQRVASLLTSFKTHILAVDPHIDSVPDGIKHVSLEDALRQADILTIHCSGENCIIGESELNIMKKGAFLLNASRGGLVDEDALVKVLDSGQLAGAWLDTFNREPYNGPLCGYPNVILTPHVGSYTKECRYNMEMESVKNLITGFD